MSSPSRPPNFKQYRVKPRCYGCGRRLVAKHEPFMWFTGGTRPAVFGDCCTHIAAVYNRGFDPWQGVWEQAA